MNQRDMTRRQRQAQLDDKARIRSQIDEGLAGLRSNMTIAMAGLQSSTDALIKGKVIFVFLDYLSSVTYLIM